MNMDTLLIEIGAEEIPAGYIEPALQAFSSLVTRQLAHARIEHGAARVYGTPRRLTVEIADVAAARPRHHGNDRSARERRV